MPELNIQIVTNVAAVEIGADPVVEIVELGVVGPQGPAVPVKTLRHDWAAPYDYLGTALLGTADGTAGWTITRLTVSTAGAVTATGTATNVTWTGRASHTYT